MAVAHIEISSYGELYDQMRDDNGTVRPVESLYSFYHLRWNWMNYTEHFADDDVTGWRFWLFVGFIIFTALTALILNGAAIYQLLFAEKDPVDKWSIRSLLLANSSVINIVFVVCIYFWEALFLFKRRWLFPLDFFVFCVNMEEVFSGMINAILISLCLNQLLQLVIVTHNRAFWISMAVILNVFPVLYSAASAAPWLIKRRFVVEYYADGIVDISQWHGSDIKQYSRHVTFADLIFPFVLSHIFLFISFGIHITRKQPRRTYSRMGSREAPVFWRAEQPDDSVDDDVFHHDPSDHRWTDITPVIKTPRLSTVQGQRLPSKSDLAKEKLKTFNWIPAAFLAISVLFDSWYYGMFYMVVNGGWPFVKWIYAFHVIPVFFRPVVVIVSKSLELRKRREEERKEREQNKH